MTKLRNEVGNEALAIIEFQRVREDLRALRQEELLPISLNLPAAVARILGVLPKLAALRAEIVAALPAFRIDRFDRLETFALALSHTHASYLAVARDTGELKELTVAAIAMRRRLLAEARSLTHHGIVHPAQLSRLIGTSGVKNIATDLSTLANLLREAQQVLKEKALSTPEDLDTAERMATRMVRLFGRRRHGKKATAEAADLRQRAYTLLLIAYADARRAVTYLRPAAGDADRIAPPLHTGGRPRRRPARTPAAPTGASTVRLESETDGLATETPPSAGTGAGGPFVN